MCPQPALAKAAAEGALAKAAAEGASPAKATFSGKAFLAPKAKASRPDKDKRSAEHEVPGPQSQVSLKRFFEQVADKEPIPQPVLWPEAENGLGGLEKSKETVICSDCRLRKEVSEPGGQWVGRLGDPNVWLCVGVLRSDIIKTIDGGVGNCLRHYVHTLFGQDFNLATAGILIDGVARTYCLCATVSCLINDELGHKQRFHCKGQAGKKPCFLCRNVVCKGGLPRGHATLREINCTSYAARDVHADQTIWQIVDDLRGDRNAMTTDAFEKRHTCGVHL